MTCRTRQVHWKCSTPSKEIRYCSRTCFTAQCRKVWSTGLSSYSIATCPTDFGMSSRAAELLDHPRVEPVDVVVLVAAVGEIDQQADPLSAGQVNIYRRRPRVGPAANDRAFVFQLPLAGAVVGENAARHTAPRWGSRQAARRS